MSLDQNALDALRRGHSPALPPQRSHRRRWIVIAIGAVGALIAAWWLFGSQPLEVSSATVVALPADAPPAAVLDASGFVVARRQATVSAKVTGKVMSIDVEEGMTVKAGQVLARLDDSQARLQYTLAERQVEATQGGLTEVEVRRAEAQRTLARNEKLFADKLVAEAALDAARADVAALSAQHDALQGQLAVARSTLRVRGQDLEDLVIRAPFAGVVISKDAQPGEMISPISAGGGYTRTGIATIVDMDSREIEVDVNEAFINRVRDGQKTEAVLDAYPDLRIPSHVLNVVPAADRQKATVRVRIAFDQLDPRILPDMGIKVRFLGDANTNSARAAGTTLIPAEALVDDNGKSFVWRVGGEQVTRIAVVVGSTRDGNVEVTAGLEAGDVIVSPPVTGLVDGARVRIKPPTS
jgi:RND family efflux transporter MFP subunit